MVQIEPLGDLGQRFVLRPNCSASWRQVKIFMLVISTVCLAVAGAFASLGFWPILPFAGAELALLGYAMWLTSHRSAHTEVVAIEDQTVEVEKGTHQPSQRWSFQRTWAQVSLVPASVARHPSKLFIGSHGRRVHLGGFLTETERQHLARSLRAALGGVGAGTKIEHDEKSRHDESIGSTQR